ncbi:hypothetical protein [Acidovorax sp.]|uniref:hypothetical protein n=1 Tax=Acidovorax sp. TaxID=1872122 RepID=UPI003D019020
MPKVDHCKGGQFEIEIKGARAPQPQLQPGSVLLVAMPLGIALQLRASGHWADTMPGAPLQLVAGLPDHIIHLQRRRFPRLETPLGQPFRAEFMLYGETFSMGVDDVSIGGLGLRASAHEGRLLMPSQQLRRVRVELGHGASPLMVDLEVRSRRALPGPVARRQRGAAAAPGKARCAKVPGGATQAGVRDPLPEAAEQRPPHTGTPSQSHRPGAAALGSHCIDVLVNSCKRASKSGCPW